MLNLNTPESSSVCDLPAERSKRPRADSDAWNVAWSSDTHRRLESLGDIKVVINWMNGAWEVKGDEHAVPVRGVVDQFVRWFLGGTFQPRTDENDWCKHIFRESNKAADTHAMHNGDSGPGAQWEARLISPIKCINHVTFYCLSMGPEGGADWVQLLGYCGYGMNTDLFRKSHMVDVC